MNTGISTQEIARMVDCPKSVVESHEERNDPLYYRLFKSLMRGSYEGSINTLKLVDKMQSPATN